MLSKGVLVLAAAGYAAAASSTCTFSKTQTIDTPAATAALASCDVVKGSIAITSDGTVDFSGPSEIDGDVVAENNANLTSLTSSSLKKITGKLSLQGVTSLASLSLSALTSVKELDVVTAPLLQSLGFSSSGVSSVSIVKIEDTFINSLDGLSPSSVDTFSININKRLTEISMPFTSASSLIQLSANGQSMSASFPNLEWAKSMVIQNVTTFSAPSLAAVNNSLQFDSNYFTSVACPNLTETGDSLSLIGNSNVKNVSFPALTKIGGGFDVLNNTNLGTIDGFPKLREVDGAVVVKGTYSKISLPKIDVVQGTAVFSSSSDISDSCKELTSSNKDNVWAVKPDCISNNTASADDSSTTDTAGSGNNTSGSDNNAAAGLIVSHIMLGFVAAGALLHVLL